LTPISSKNLQFLSSTELPLQDTKNRMHIKLKNGFINLKKLKCNVQ